MKPFIIIAAATLFLSASAAGKVDKKADKALKQAKRDAIRSAKAAKPVKAPKAPKQRVAATHQNTGPEGNAYTYYSASLSLDYEKPVLVCPLASSPNGGFRPVPSGAEVFGNEDYTKYLFYYRSSAVTNWAAAPCIQEPHVPKVVPTVAEVLPNGEVAHVLTVDGSAFSTGDDVIAAFKIPASRSLGENGLIGFNVGYCVTSSPPTATIKSTIGTVGGSGQDANELCMYDGDVANCQGWDACTGLSPNTTGPYVKLAVEGMPGSQTAWGGLAFDSRADYYDNSIWRYNTYNPSGTDYAVTLRDWSSLFTDRTTYQNSGTGGIPPVTDSVLLKYGSASPFVMLTAGMRYYYEAYFAYPYDSYSGTTSADYLNLQVGCPNAGVLETRYIILNWRHLHEMRSQTSGNIYHTGASYVKLVCDRRAPTLPAPPLDPTNQTQVIDALAAANTTAEATAILVSAGIAFASSQGNRCNAACANGLPTACDASNNAGVCSKCLSVGSCTKAVGDTTTGRQAELNGILFVACPQLTRLEQSECFAQAACDGLINHDIDACTMNGVTFVCPVCPGDGSKKGLLGLLGLLALIPLFCLSLLCCLLLLSIRRKKTQGDVLVATFDGQPAPLCTMPMDGFVGANPTVFA